VRRAGRRAANDFASAFLMPAPSVLGHMPHGAHVDQVIKGKRIWKVSAMALTYRLHDLRLLTNWQYRSACTELSNRGYRTDEPHGLKKRETSQVLTKVFQRLRATGVRPGGVAAELGISVDELNTMLFGLTITAVAGGGETTTSERERTLSLVT
jgi:Zn-dependent peptidase ImmA (M78 family)